MCETTPFETTPSDKTTGLSFSAALDHIKQGGRATRAGWNGRGMFVFLVAGSEFIVNRPPLLGIYLPGAKVRYHAHIDMKTADGTIVPWIASQTDILTDDWDLVPTPPEMSEPTDE